MKLPDHSREDVNTEVTRPSCPLVCGSISLIRWCISRFPQAARAAALVAAALIIAAAYNAADPMGIPWTLSPDGRVGIPRAYESRLPQITAAQAFDLFQSGEALFVDSRDADDYEKDHIPGAINLPQRKWAQIWPHMWPQLPRDKALVLYCYGAHCGLSTRQGKLLLDNGYDKLLVLDYGWRAWTEAGYPTMRDLEGEGS
jgi:rhodanese-related sulfurtransferase